MSAELRTPGDENCPMDRQTVASVTEYKVATLFAFINIGQTLTQGHRWRTEK